MTLCVRARARESDGQQRDRPYRSSQAAVSFDFDLTPAVLASSMQPRRWYKDGCPIDLARPIKHAQVSSIDRSIESLGVIGRSAAGALLPPLSSGPWRSGANHRTRARRRPRLSRHPSAPSGPHVQPRGTLSVLFIWFVSYHSTVLFF
jgi:hypothetical protein